MTLTVTLCDVSLRGHDRISISRRHPDQQPPLALLTTPDRAHADGRLRRSSSTGDLHSPPCSISCSSDAAALSDSSDGRGSRSGSSDGCGGSSAPSDEGTVSESLWSTDCSGEVMPRETLQDIHNSHWQRRRDIRASREASAGGGARQSGFRKDLLNASLRSEQGTAVGRARRRTHPQAALEARNTAAAARCVQRRPDSRLQSPTRPAAQAQESAALPGVQHQRRVVAGLVRPPGRNPVDKPRLRLVSVADCGELPAPAAAEGAPDCTPITAQSIRVLYPSLFKHT